MKKISLLILIIVNAAVCFAQFPANPVQSNSSTNNIFNGAITAKKGLVSAVYNDTTAANLDTYTKGVPHILIVTKNNNIWKRNATATKWLLMTTGTVQTCNGLQSGGIVTWDGGLSFDVTAATYCINNSTYNSLSGSITLNTADITLPRLDVIAVDTFGLIVKITGVPNANPVIPQIDLESQVYLTSILIPANSTTPAGVTMLTVYDENVEWTTSSTGSITANFNNLVNPYRLLKSAGINNATSGSISFQNPLVINSTTYNTLKFFIRNTATSALSVLSATLTLNGVAVTNDLIVNSSLGYNNITTGSYQNISIPISNFSFLGASNYNGLRIGLRKYGQANIDYVTLQGGISNNTNFPYITDIFRKKGTDSVFKVINGISQFAFKDSIGSGGGSSSGIDSGAYRNTVSLNDSTFTLTRANGLKDTIVFVGGGGIKYVDSVTTSNDSLFYYKNAVKTFVTNIATAAAGGDTTIFATILDSTGQANTKVLYAKNRKIASDGSFLYDDINKKLVINSLNISIDGAATKLYVAGNTTTEKLKLLSPNTAVGTKSLRYNPTTKEVTISDTTVTGGSGSGWGLTGNAGTTPNTNFIGTTDNKSFRIRTNNIDRLHIDSISGNVGIGTIAPHLSAIADISSATKGFLIPRLTNTQRNDIALPATGLMIYNTTTSAFNYFNGSLWIEMAQNVGSFILGSGVNLYYGGIANGNFDTWDGTFAYHQRGVIDLTHFTQTIAGSRWREASNINTDILLIKATGNVGVNVPTNTVNASASLEIGGTTKGFLPPRPTTTQRNAIASPAEGLQVYNTTTKSNDFYNGSVWVSNTGILKGQFSATGSATTTFTVTLGETQLNNTYNLAIAPTSIMAGSSYYISAKTTTTFDITYLTAVTGAVSVDWTLFK